MAISMEPTWLSDMLRDAGHPAPCKGCNILDDLDWLIEQVVDLENAELGDLHGYEAGEGDVDHPGFRAAVSLMRDLEQVIATAAHIRDLVGSELKHAMPYNVRDLPVEGVEGVLGLRKKFRQVRPDTWDHVNVAHAVAQQHIVNLFRDHDTGELSVPDGVEQVVHGAVGEILACAGAGIRYWLQEAVKAHGVPVEDVLDKGVREFVGVYTVLADRT